MAENMPFWFEDSLGNSHTYGSIPSSNKGKSKPTHKLTEKEKLQEQINELKAIIMELRATMKHHIDGYPDYVERRA